MNRVVLALFLTVLPTFVLGQSVAPGVDASGRVDEFPPGGVVERIVKNSEADRAGLRAGDVLLAWNRGEIEDEIRSPLALYNVGVEQKSQGTVILVGLRNGQERAGA